MKLMALFAVISTILFLTNSCMALAEDTVRSDHYEVCPVGHVWSENQTQSEQLAARSPQDCMATCSRLDTCTAVNLCPGEMEGQVKCTLLRKELPGSCDGLVIAASSSLCFHAYQEMLPPTTTTTTTPAPSTTLWCRNGGTLNGNQCDCPFQFAGPACERHVRDCSEAYDSGKTDGTAAELTIQPIGAPAPFKVRCRYSWGGVTTLLLWDSAAGSLNLDYATMNTVIGADPMAYNYFVGLDNMHFLTAQADCELNFVMNTKSHLYDNFTFGPASSSYATSYDRYRSGTYGDGFAVPGPVHYNGQGHDPEGCHAAQGQAGWYGAGCTGYPLFTGGNFDWPDGNGGTVSVNALVFKLVRQSPYYSWLL